MYELAPLIYDLALMLGLACIVVLLFQRIRQPVVLGYLIAGMIVGPHTPPYELVKDVENIQILSELGVIFLMFSLGLEFSFQKLTRVGLPALITGIAEVLLMIIIGYWIGKAFGWSHNDALFLGAALSISSTTIIIKAIDELGLRNKRFAELIFGVLIVEDLLAILLLVALSTVVYTENVFSFDLVTAAIRLVIVVSAWFLAGYFLIVPFFKMIASYISQETLTILSVALCLLLVCIAASFHYSTPLGAFIMGSILAETPLIHRIEELIRPIRDIFAAVFFISVGMLIDPNVIVQQWQIVFLLSLITIVGKIVSTGFGALVAGQSFDRAVRTGFGMAQIGEFSFIIITLGLSLEAINTWLYPIIVAVSAITTFTTPYLIRASAMLSHKLEGALPSRIKFVQQLYSTSLFNWRSTTNHKTWLGPFALRVIFNGILIASIFSLIHYLVFHRFVLFNEHTILPSISFLVVSIIFASPFIWGMLFAHRVLPHHHRPIYYNILVIIVWSLAFLEVFILSLAYFNTLVTVVIFLMLALLFVLAFKQLEALYHWFEFNLVSNLTQKHDSKMVYKELAPWDVHLFEVELGRQSELINQTLKDIDQSLLHGILILAICREETIFFPYCFDVQIHPHDKLIIIGMDDDVEQFKNKVSYNPRAAEVGDYLNRFNLTPYLITENHFLINKTIHEANSTELLAGKIVGLDRAGQRIFNPDITIKLAAHDLLLIVNVY